MNIQSALYGRARTYRAELRVMIANTAADGRRERSWLQQSVLPELRKRSGERGVIIMDRDPRWEMSLAPGRAQSIRAERMSELHGFRPVVIAILGDGGWSRTAAERARFPWLHDMAADDDPEVAFDFIERVVDSPLMQERAFFYMLRSGPGTAPRRDGDERLARLSARVRDGRFAVREGIDDLESLGRQILDDLLEALDRLHPADAPPSLLEQIRRSHRSFAARLRRAYEEMPRYFDQLDEHVMEGGAPLVISGRSGAGKSALIANWMEYFAPQHPGTPVICHHVEAASARADHGSALRHVMAELKERHGISDALPDSTDALVKAFPEWLARVGDDRLVVVIDGLDQLDAPSRSLDWLPATAAIPANVRLIVCTTGVGEAGDTVIDRLLDRDWRELRVKPLTMKQQRSIINRLLGETAGELGADLLGSLRLGDDIARPLFVRMVAGQLRSSGSERERNELLDARTGAEFLEKMFRQIEERFGGSFFGEVIRLLWGARLGLLESELLELTGADRDALNNVLASAGNYLVEQDGLWTFAHGQIRAAVERRYLPDADARRAVHLRLAGYFAGQPATGRRADEEPWQLEQAGEREKLARCIADIAIFMRLSVEDRRHELLQYWVRLNDEGLLVESYDRSFEEWRSRDPRPEEQAEVAERLGLFLTGSGFLREAEGYLRLALDLFRSSRGAVHPETARAAHMLAELLRQNGKFGEADRLFQEALAVMEQALPPDSPELAQVLSDIGLLYRDSGQHGLALPYYERALDLKERIHGADHPATAEVLNDLGLYYLDRQEFEKAIPLFLRSLDIYERRLGAKHPATATAINSIAVAYLDSGNLERAEEFLQRALDIRQEMLGEHHPHTVVTIANLASLLHRRNKLEEACAMFGRAVISSEASLGEEHPNTISLNANHALILRTLNQNAAAEEIYRRTLVLASRALGDTHPLVGTCANNLATVLWKQGRNDEATPLFERAIASWRESIGPEHPNIAIAQHVLAMIRIDQGNSASAEALLLSAIAIREKHLGIDHELTSSSRELLRNLRGE